MQIRLKSRLLIGILMLSIGFNSCYEPSDGCLDLLASNYDVSADDGCDECCTYPTVNLVMKHLWSDTTFRFGDTLIDQFGDQFVLLDQKMMLSKFNYQSNNFDKVGTLTFTIDGEEQIFENDFTLIIKNQTSVSVNNYRAEGMIDGYSFQFGLDGLIHKLSETQADSDTDLDYSKSMRFENEYASYYLQFARGQNLTDTLNFFFNDDYLISVDSMATITKGATLTLPLTINYSNLFDGIRFKDDNVTQITQKIKSNTTNSLY